jgi:hypothetical protein
MHKNATKCNKTQNKCCINKHGASKIIDTFETYHTSRRQNEVHATVSQMHPIIKAEYEALLHDMRMEKACGATRIKIFGDSNLVVQQVMNPCDALSYNMNAYQDPYYNLEGSFDGCKESHISRSSSEETNNLANIGSQCLPLTAGVFWEEIS